MAARKPDTAEGLTVKQVMCIDAIVAGHKITEAAKIAKVDQKTLWNWRQTQKFRDAIRRRLQDKSEASGHQGVGLVPECLGVLKAIMNSPTSDDADRIRAATAIMASATTFREQREMEDYISKLEERLERLATALPQGMVQSFEAAPLESAAVEEEEGGEAEDA